MSPLAVRRYRAERLLRAEFRRLEARVTQVVARRLAAAGLALDKRDVQASYAVAWQGLYEATLQGEQVANPAGWLVVATHRRAIDEHRARARAGHRNELAGLGPDALEGCGAAGAVAGGEDLAEALSDRELLRQLFEGLQARLSAPEREAAVLCYLHGLTRAQAAAAMGISERRMDRLIDGCGPGREGAAGKLGALVASIREGRWCEQQGSLMRGLAFGILDRRGERYRLALAHSSECPACRAYVASLRGLGAVLPPMLLPGSLAAAILARAAGKAGAAGSAGTGAAASHGGSAGGQLAGGGVLSGAAGAGAGGAGSGWVLAGGPLGAKLAAGCLLALGIGAGCVGLGIGPRAAQVGGGGPSRSQRAHRASSPAHESVLASAPTSPAPGAGAAPVAGGGEGAGPSGEAARASREFGPEGGNGAPVNEGGRALARAASADAARSSLGSSRSSATARRGRHGSGRASTGASAASAAAQIAQPQRESAAAGSGAEASSAEREFGPG